ncbi:MAG: 2-phospho-L-lactate transferase [Friedmanniella sp.]
MQIVVLAGGVGGSTFVQGVRRGYPGAQITVVGNTADDITLHGLRICPDLDTMLYRLGGGGDEQRGWGRQGETWRVLGELAAYGAEPSWFSIGDLDLATHLVRTQLLAAGYTLTEATQALASRWLADDPLLRVLPMSDDRVETHVVIAAPEQPSGRRAVHFQEYWVRLHAVPDALEVVRVGIETARPAPAVLEALSTADLVLIAPSNPVVSIGPILAVPGLREAVRAGAAPVVGFSGILGGAPVLGMAHRLLPAIDVEVDAAAVGLHYGSRAANGVLDLWVMDSRDAGSADRVRRAGLDVAVTDLVMHDPDATASFVRETVEQLPTGSAPAA